jgi:hypothetical protein
MSRWGANSFQDDAAMDRVGDVWREIFKDLRRDFICSVLSPHFQKAKPEPLSLMLWTACETELPDSFINRIGCLLTTDIGVAKAFLARLGRQGVTEVLKRMCAAAPTYGKLAAAAAVSFFCSKLELKLDDELVGFAVEHLTGLLADTKDPTGHQAIESELEKLAKAK